MGKPASIEKKERKTKQTKIQKHKTNQNELS